MYYSALITMILGIFSGISSSCITYSLRNYRVRPMFYFFSISRGLYLLLIIIIPSWFIKLAVGSNQDYELFNLYFSWANILIYAFTTSTVWITLSPILYRIIKTRP